MKTIHKMVENIILLVYNYIDNTIIKGGNLMKEQVAAVLDKVRPVLQRDGGDVELIDVGDDGTVVVRLQGACAGCPGATMTLKAVIENLLVKEVPGVTRVVGV